MIETIFRVLVIIIIIGIVLAVVSSIGIPSIAVFEYSGLLSSFLKVICYIIPFSKLLPIFGGVVGFAVFKGAIALLRTVWDIFPIKG